MNQKQQEEITKLFGKFDSKEDLYGRTLEDDSSTLVVESVTSAADSTIYFYFTGSQRRKDNKIQKIWVTMELTPDGDVYMTSYRSVITKKVKEEINV